jgi:hypothetical protein
MYYTPTPSPFSELLIIFIRPQFSTMQCIVPDRLQAVRKRLLEEIKATKKRIHRDLHPLFNLTMQNKIDHANRILRLMDRYPKMTVKEFLFLIDCRIEDEKFVISSYRWSVQMLQEQYDNRDNLERLQFLVWHEGVGQWED